MHHLDTVNSLNNYDRNQAFASLAPREDLDAIDFEVMDDADSVAAIAAANELAPVQLSDKQIGQLMAFLNSLTDPASVAVVELLPFCAVYPLCIRRR